MADISKLKEILDTATRFETDAHEFYSEAVDIVKDPSAKELLRDFARIELKHKEKLENFDLNMIADEHHSVKETHDLKISQYLMDKEINPNSTVQDIMIHAMKREQRAYEFYDDMLKIVTGADVRKLFEELRAEELDHKEKIETEYDDIVYKEF